MIPCGRFSTSKRRSPFAPLRLILIHAGMISPGAIVISKGFAGSCGWSGGTILSAAQDGSVKLWDAAEIKERAVIEQTDWPNALTFLADGAGFVAGRVDGTLGFYQTKDAQPLAIPPAKLGSIEPRGIQRSSVPSAPFVPVKLRGTNLAGLRAALASDQRIRVQFADGANANEAQLFVKADAKKTPAKVPAAKAPAAKAATKPAAKTAAKATGAGAGVAGAAVAAKAAAKPVAKAAAKPATKAAAKPAAKPAAKTASVKPAAAKAGPAKAAAKLTAKKAPAKKQGLMGSAAKAAPKAEKPATGVVAGTIAAGTAVAGAAVAAASGAAGTAKDTAAKAMGSVGDAAGAVAGTAGNAADKVGNAASAVAGKTGTLLAPGSKPPGSDSEDGMGWLLWLVAAALLLFALWWMFGPSGNDGDAVNAAPTEAAATLDGTAQGAAASGNP